jgi:hypothetical protein
MQLVEYLMYRARICKRLRSPGIDFVRQIGLMYRPARLGIDSWEGLKNSGSEPEFLNF